MTNKQIKRHVEIALRRYAPVEVRVHRSSSDTMDLLLISENFKTVGMYERIKTCIDLIMEQSEEIADEMTFIVEPVTPAEFKTRNAPWPK